MKKKTYLLPLFIILSVSFALLYSAFLFKYNISEIIKILVEDYELFIFPDNPKKSILSEDIIKEIRKIKGIDKVIPYVKIISKYDSAKEQDIRILFCSIIPQAEKFPRNYILVSGRMLQPKDENSVVIDFNLAKDLKLLTGDFLNVKFPDFNKDKREKGKKEKKDKIEPTFNIPARFKIVGIVKKRISFKGDYYSAFVTLNGIKKVLKSPTQEFRSVSIKLKKGYEVKRVKEKLKRKLGRNFSFYYRDKSQRIKDIKSWLFSGVEKRVIILILAIAGILLLTSFILIFHQFSWRNQNYFKKLIILKQVNLSSWNSLIYSILDFVPLLVIPSGLGLVLSLPILKILVLFQTSNFQTNQGTQIPIIINFKVLLIFVLGTITGFIVFCIPLLLNNRIPLKKLLLLSDEDYLRGRRWRIKKLTYLPLRYVQTKLTTSAITIITIALGVAMVFAVSISNQGISSEMARSLERHIGKVHLIVKPKKESISFNEAILNKIKNMHGVKVASYMARVHFVAEKNEQLFPIEIWAFNPHDEKEIKEYDIRKGRYLKKNTPVKEIVLSRLLMDRYEYEIGEKLNIKGKVKRGGGGVSGGGVSGGGGSGGGGSEGGKVKIEGKPFQLVIVGEVVNLKSDLFNTGVGLIDINDLDNSYKFPRGKENSEVAIRIKSISDVFKVQSALEKMLGGNYTVLDAEDYVKAATFEPLILVFQLCLMAVSFISIFIGANLVSNIFSMNIKDRMREIGILRAVGAKRGQVFLLFLREAFVCAVVGTSAGLGIGLMLAVIIIKITEKAFWSATIPFIVSTNWLLISAGTGIITTVLSALIPAYRASKQPPANALRGEIKSIAPKQNKFFFYLGVFSLLFSFPLMYFNFSSKTSAMASFPLIGEGLGRGNLYFIVTGIILGTNAFLCLIPFLIPLLLPFISAFTGFFFKGEGFLAQNYLNWNKTRSIVSIIAVTASTAMIIIVGGMESFHEKVVDGFIEKRFGSDLLVFSYDVPKKIVNSISKIENIDKVTYIKDDRMKIQHRDFYVFFIEPKAFFELSSFPFYRGNENEAKKKLLQGSYVLISRRAAKMLGKNYGDDLFVDVPGGRVKFKIAGLILGFYDFSGEVVFSYADYEKYFQGKEVDGFLIKVSNKEKIDIVKRKIKDLFDLQKCWYVVETPNEMKDWIKKQINRTAGLFKASYYIVLIIVTITIFNTLFLNVRERTKELGILRAVGANKSKIRKLIIAESFIICQIGVIIGIVCGIYNMQGFIKATEYLIGTPSAYVVPFRTMIFAFLITIILSIMGGLIPAIKASETTVAEAIRYE